jgi:hypothetical protein
LRARQSPLDTWRWNAKGKMTEVVEARRSERVLYRVPVELYTRGGALTAGSVRAEAVDIGEGGMRVCASTSVPVGAHVTCRVAIDGRDAALPGRVVWLEHGERVHGIGICFDPLGSDEAALLQHAVESSREGYRSIELRFADGGPRVLARARARGNGLRLSAVLPILARGTELSFRLDEEGPQFKGRVADATLHEEEGARRLEVDVDVLPDDGVRFRRRARYGYAAEIEAGEQRAMSATSAGPAVPVGLQAVAARLRASRSRASKLAALLLAATSGGLLGWSAARLPAAPPARSALAHPERPVLEVEDDVTRVLLPFEGDLSQMQARLRPEPFALAVDLPHGRVKLDEGSYPLHVGSAAELRVQRRSGAELIRLTLAAPLARYAIAVQEGTLELRLQRQPAVAPRF